MVTTPTPCPIKPLIHGYLDAVDRQPNGEIRIAGWIFREDARLETVDIVLNGHLWLSSIRLQERPDVLATYRATIGDRPHLAWSGFDVTAEMPHGLTTRAPVLVTLTPRTADGLRLDPFVTYSVDGSKETLLPPVHLQERVGGSDEFVAVARQLTSDLLSYFHKWKPFFEADAILDWGCGCGRVIAQLSQLVSPDKLHGCDIDAEAIAWDQANLSGVSFARVEPYPPTPYADESFDLVYGISVMTHLGEGAQHAWLSELRRITRPGAVLALSIIGRNLRATNMPKTLEAEFAEKGFAAFVPDYSDMLTHFSHAGFYQEAYHSIGYVQSVWAEYFEVLEYIDAGHQDIVLLRRRRGESSQGVSASSPLRRPSKLEL